MTAYREQIALAARAAAVVSKDAFTWFGRRAPRVAAGPLPGGERAHLVHALAGVLYRSFYSQGTPVPVSAHDAEPAPPDPAFVDALSGANAGEGGWEPGWRVAHVAPSGIEVARDGLRVRVADGECRPSGARTAGAPVSVRRPKELRAISPGFYTALGDAAPPVADDALEVRVYFHVTAAGAVALVAACTRLLNRAGVPFELKVVANPAAFVRCDAAVLYLAGGGFARAPLREVVSACRPHLRATVPAFAKPLAPGVALGEHRPSSGASFGAVRCELVAEGLVEAHRHRATSLDARVDAVARRFADSGLDVGRPYLAGASTDRYGL